MYWRDEKQGNHAETNDMRDRPHVCPRKEVSWIWLDARQCYETIIYRVDCCGYHGKLINRGIFLFDRLIRLFHHMTTAGLCLAVIDLRLSFFLESGDIILLPYNVINIVHRKHISIYVHKQFLVSTHINLKIIQKHRMWTPLKQKIIVTYNIY